MRKLLGAVCAAVLAASAITYAQRPASVPYSDSESTQLWFVELSSAPTAEGTAPAALDQEHAAFQAAASSAGIRYTESRRFQKLWNGVTVRAAARDVAKLRALPGVRSVYPVQKVRLSQQDDPSRGVTDLITAITMTGADVAHSELGLTGRGVRVAVMDTGIDYDHPDLGGCFGPGCRVDKGYDLVGDAYNADDANPIVQPDPFPDDCAGHGTHVAGIIGANGGITGVAPEVTFHAYRVFGCEGTTTDEIMLAAMEMVLDDGADVLNMSIGSAYQWPEYPTAQASSRLTRKGVAVVASIGNDGATGLYSASAPGVGDDVIGVASYDNIAGNLPAFTISPDSAPVGYIAATGAPAAPTSGSAPMARTGTTTSTADACTAPAPGSLAGKVALIRRGTCSFYIKAANAQNAGAIGVVLYNNTSGFINPTVAGTPAITIPVVAITAAQGALINGRLASGPVTMTWTNTTHAEPNPTGGLISSFSSYGAAPDLSFKPDLGAPGGTIRSTLPLEQGGYGILSGTSMASPHVAGAVALMLQAHPHMRPAELKERLQNTSRPAAWWGNPGLGFLDNVHRQGAGLIRVDDAATSPADVSPSNLPLGEIERGSVTRTIRVTRGTEGRGTPERVTYTLSHEPALATGASTFAPEFLASFADVTFDAPSVTLKGNGAGASIKATITPPPVGDGARLFGGYIVLTPDDDSPVLRVPYTGYDGDYQQIQALTPTPNGFPWLATLMNDGNLYNQPSGATYTMQGNDVPFILLHLDHQVQQLTMNVVDVTTGRSVDLADDESFIGRNSSATSFFALAWDGTTVKKAGGKVRTLPNGTYRIELSVLKALGDPKNPAHVEHWTSPNITIARP